MLRLPHEINHLNTLNELGNLAKECLIYPNKLYLIKPTYIKYTQTLQTKAKPSRYSYSA
jgi:hypothetical protein